MLLSKKQSIEDLIIEILAKNPYTEGPDLVLLISKIRPNTTKQAVYAALKSLTESETVAKVATKYFLSRIWLQKVYDLFEIQKKKELISEALFSLQDGESINYRFPSLLDCDMYWAHVYNLLTDWIQFNIPVFMWNPHEIFVIGRKNIESYIFINFPKKNKYCYFVTRGNTKLDQQFKRNWANTHISINTNDIIALPDNTYINVFDDFIIEVFFDDRLVKRIEHLYQKVEKLSSKDIHEFEELFKAKYPVRLKISRKKKKAQLLHKKLAKDFFIPKHLTLE